MDERFPRSARIVKGWEFQELKNQGTSQRGKFVVFSYHVSQDPFAARIGIIVSKRVGGAVTRNKVKRRYREISRKNRHLLLPGVRLVLIARHFAASATFDELSDDWLRVAKRAAIFAPPE